MNGESKFFSGAQTADLLRFASAGVIAYIYLFVTNRGHAVFLAEATGAIGFPLILVVSGSLIYFLYRPLLYDPIIRRCFNKLKGGRNDYCRQLSARFGIERQMAEPLWRVLQERTLAERSPRWEARASGIHMTFIGATLAVPFATTCFVRSQWPAGTVILLFGLLCLSAGLLHGKTYELEEFNRLRALSEDTLAEIVQSFRDMSLTSNAGGIETQHTA